VEERVVGAADLGGPAEGIEQDCESAGVFVSKEMPATAMVGHLAVAGGVAANHRAGLAARFEQDEGQALPARGQDDAIGRGHPVDDIGLRAVEAHEVSDVELLREVFHPRPKRAITEQVELGAGGTKFGLRHMNGVQ